MNENAKLYVGLLIILLGIVCATFYSHIEMEKRSKNWTKAQWDEYYSQHQIESEIEQDYQPGAYGPE